MKQHGCLLILNFNSILFHSITSFNSLSIMEATHQDYHMTSIMADSRNMIIKGKRTKRPRPSSPLALTMATTSSTTTATSTDDDDGIAQNPNINNFHISTSSIEFTKVFQENEEEDMAKCLILLAQGQTSSPPLPLRKSEAVEVARTSGFYVYECKTCYRGFSSFQALGGHRASHKVKPFKPNIIKQDVDVNHSSTTLSLQVGSTSSQMTHCNPSGSVKVAKVHECSICGAEFGSGQALGGHMRRHRSMPMATTSSDGSGGCQEFKKPKTLLSLDLNLPAPVEDDQRETKLAFRSRDLMIAFSNPSLVHCRF